MVFPRLLSKASALGDLMWSGGSVIAEPTKANLTNSTITPTAGQFVQESVAAVASGLAASQDEIGIFQALKNVASFFSYITSKWAIATFAIVSHPTPHAIAILILLPRPFSSTERISTRLAVSRSPSTVPTCVSPSTLHPFCSSYYKSRASSRLCDARHRLDGLTCNTETPGDSWRPISLATEVTCGALHRRFSFGKPRRTLAKLLTCSLWTPSQRGPPDHLPFYGLYSFLWASASLLRLCPAPCKAATRYKRLA
jgi:hypothetical protein